MSITAARIREIVADLLGQDVVNVTDGASFVDDLGADSLNVVEIVVEVENEFHREIDDEAAERVKTVGELIRIVEAMPA